MSDRISYKKIVDYLLEQAWQDEVIDTGMKDLIIGERLDFADKQDWIDSKMRECLEETNQD
jgi:predicted transcriptional regulator